MKLTIGKDITVEAALNTAQEVMREAEAFIDRHFPKAEEGSEARELMMALRASRLLVRALAIAVEMEEAGAPYKMIDREEKTDDRT